MSNMYDILGKLKSVIGLNSEPVEAKTEPVYESVEPRGSIMEAVKSLEEKYMGFKKTVAAVKKGGSAENPEAVAAAIGRKKYGKKKFQKAAAAGKKLGEGDEITDLDAYQFADPDSDADIKPATSKADRAAVRQRIQDLADKKREKDDWFDGSDKESNIRVHRAKYQDEPEVDEATTSTGGEVTKVGNVTTHKANKYGGADTDFDKREYPFGYNRKRPVDVGDDEDLDESSDEAKLQRYHDLVNRGMDPDDAQARVFNDEDDEEDLDEVSGATLKSYLGKNYRSQEEHQQNIEDTPFGSSKEWRDDAERSADKLKQRRKGEIVAKHKLLKKGELDEVAPPGAKAERMVKHIKKGYAKDGKLTKREKGIAYATAWKAHNKGVVEGTEEYGVYANGDTDRKCEFKGSQEEAMKKAKELTSKIPSQEKAKYKAGYTTLNTGSYKAVKLKNVSEGTGKSNRDKYLGTGAQLPRQTDDNVDYDEFFRDMPSDSETSIDTKTYKKKLGKATGKLAREGVEFSDTVKNSQAKLTKAKPAVVKESRMIQESDYTYERIGRALAEQNPTLSTASPEFVAAVYNEMVAQGMKPNRARNIIKIDDDFISDVADSYNHYCQEVAECSAPMNSHLGGTMEELDEIARLAGLPTKESTLGAVAGGVAGAALGKSPAAARMGAAIGDQITDESTEDERKLERYHELIKQGMDPDDAEVMVFNDEDDSEDFMEEEIASEGNEFSGALAAAKAAGAKEFEVDGKTYTVKEETSVNDIRRLSGLAETEEVVEEDEELAEERDIEYVNTPREKTAPLSAAIPSGTDLHKSKMQDPETANKAANPLTRKAKQVEESLWKSYEDMIDDVKAK